MAQQPPPPADNQSFQETTNAYFNDAAKTWDSRKDVRDLTQQVVVAISKIVTLDPSTSECLDFGCGSGVLSEHFAPHCKSILGIDASQGMVDAYNAKALSLSLPNMSAICTDITSTTPDPSLSDRFHLAFTQMVLHHVPDPKAAITALARALAPGGYLVITDIEKKAGSDGFHGSNRAHKHHVAHEGGFDEATVRGWFEEAGLVGFTWKSGEVTMEKDMNARKDVDHKHSHGHGHGHGHGHEHGGGHQHGHGHGHGDGDGQHSHGHGHGHADGHGHQHDHHQHSATPDAPHVSTTPVPDIRQFDLFVAYARKKA